MVTPPPTPPWSMLFSRQQKCSGHTSTLFFWGEGGVSWVNRALEGSILKLNIQRAFFLTFLSKIVVDSEIDEPSTVHEALKGEQSDRWKEAMKYKYSSLIKNGMWELHVVPPPEGKNFVGSPWVLKVKHNEEGSMDRFEARLVAQGYSQVEGIDYKEVFSPVVAHYTSVRSLLALAS